MYFRLHISSINIHFSTIPILIFFPAYKSFNISVNLRSDAFSNIQCSIFYYLKLIYISIYSTVYGGMTFLAFFCLI